MKILAFDLDNTLFSRQECFAKYCHWLTQKYLSNCGDELETVDWLMGIDNGGKLDDLDFVKVINQKFNLNLDIKTAIWERENINPTFASLEKNTLEILTKLKTKYKLAIITNGQTVMQNIKIDSLDFRDLFEVILISQEEGVAKPSVVIFQTLCQKLNCKANDILFVGDNPIADIWGAKNAGMQTCWRSWQEKDKDTFQGWQNKEFCPNFTITGLSELLEIVN